MVPEGNVGQESDDVGLIDQERWGSVLAGLQPFSFRRRRKPFSLAMFEHIRESWYNFWVMVRSTTTDARSFVGDTTVKWMVLLIHFWQCYPWKFVLMVIHEIPKPLQSLRGLDVWLKSLVLYDQNPGTSLWLIVLPLIHRIFRMPVEAWSWIGLPILVSPRVHWSAFIACFQNRTIFPRVNRQEPPPQIISIFLTLSTLEVGEIRPLGSLIRACSRFQVGS